METFITLTLYNIRQRHEEGNPLLLLNNLGYNCICHTSQQPNEFGTRPFLR